MSSSPTRHQVVRLFPVSGGKRPIRGLYLDEKLPAPGAGIRALVYANFVTSLDGRIAVSDDAGTSHLPEGLTNPRDWRLFQELQAHADCLVTHGGYLRALAAGRLGNVLQVGVGEGSGDIVRWRAAQGMPEQPAVAILSASLDFAIPDTLARHAQPVHVLTTATADDDRKAAFEKAGYDVVATGAGPWVRARDAVEVLADRGYRRLYLQTGPRVLESALRERVLARLYLTIGHRLVGGDRFDTMIRGDAPLGVAGRLRLSALFLDEASDLDCGQLFARFDAT